QRKGPRRVGMPHQFADEVAKWLRTDEPESRVTPGPQQRDGPLADHKQAEKLGAQFDNHSCLNIVSRSRSERNSPVAADVRRLTSGSGKKAETPHVGCYGG